MSDPKNPMSTEAQEALATAKLGGLKKQLNAESWSPHMEELMKAWGEKAAGLRYMHSGASGYWRGVSNRLTLWGIGVTSVMFPTLKPQVFNALTADSRPGPGPFTLTSRFFKP